MENFEKILAKKEESHLDEMDFMEQYPDFFEDIGQEEKHEDGSVSYENEKLKVSFKSEAFLLGKFSTEDFLEMRFYLTQLGMSGVLRTDDYVQLTEFRMKNENFEYDLKSEKNSPIVIFRKNKEVESLLNFAYKEGNLIVLAESPATPEGILTLLHELGHINDEQLLKEQSRGRELRTDAIMSGGWDQDMLEERDAMTLRSERTAWAYALNKARPFIDGMNLPENSLDAFVHHVTLGSYCKTMKNDNT